MCMCGVHMWSASRPWACVAPGTADPARLRLSLSPPTRDAVASGPIRAAESVCSRVVAVSASRGRDVSRCERTEVRGDAGRRVRSARPA